MNKLTRRFVAVLMACLMILTTNGVAFAAEQIGAATAEAAAASESDVIEEDAAVEDEAAENEESSEENQDDASYEESSEEESSEDASYEEESYEEEASSSQEEVPDASSSSVEEGTEAPEEEYSEEEVTPTETAEPTAEPMAEPTDTPDEKEAEPTETPAADPTDADKKSFSITMTAVTGDENKAIGDSFSGLPVPAFEEKLDLSVSPIEGDVTSTVLVEGTSNRYYIETYKYDYAIVDGEQVTELRLEDVKADTEILLHYSVEYQKTEYVHEDPAGRFVATAVVEDAAAIPDDAIFSVKEITRDENPNAFDAYFEALNNQAEEIAAQKGDESAATYHEYNTVLYDIAFLEPKADEEGNIIPNEFVEIKPDSDKVSVKFDFLKQQLTKDLGVEDAENVTVIHLPVEENVVAEADSTDQILEDLNATEIQATVVAEQSAEVVNAEEISFDADSFSTYAINYTVDFTYDGFTYSIAGESEILLSRLFENLKIDADAARVMNATFSNPELVKVEQVEEDWLLTSLKPFTSEETLTVEMYSGAKYVIKVTDAQELSYSLEFYDQEGNKLSGMPADIQSSNPHVFVYLKDADGKIIGWRCKQFNQETNTVSFRSGKFNSGPYNQDRAVEYDPDVHTVYARVVQGDNNGGDFLGYDWGSSSYTGAVSWNGKDQFEGYKFILDATQPNVFKMQKDWKKKLEVELSYTGSDTGQSAPATIIIRGQGSTTGWHYYKLPLANVNWNEGVGSYSIPEWYKKDGSSFGPDDYSDAWTNVEAVLFEGDVAISEAAQQLEDQKKNGKPYLAGYFIKSGERKEGSIDKESGIQTMILPVVFDSTPLEDALTPEEVLGDAYEFGIVADTYKQSGHTETNFAVKHYNHGDNFDIEGSNGPYSDVPFYAGELQNGFIVGSGTNADLYLYTPQSEIDKGITQQNTGKEKHLVVPVATSLDEINEYVDGMIDAVRQTSATMAQKTTIKPAKVSEGKVVIDTQDYPDNTTIYVDCSNIMNKLSATNDVHIKKKDGQTIIMNIPDSGHVQIGKFTVFTDTYPDGVESDTVAKDRDNSHNLAVDEAIFQHVFFNMPNADTVHTDNASAMFLAPNASKFTQSNGAGWIVCGGTVDSGAEWHFYRHNRHFSSTIGSIQINKKLNSDAPDEAKKKTYKFYVREKIDDKYIYYYKNPKEPVAGEEYNPVVSSSDPVELEITGSGSYKLEKLAPDKELEIIELKDGREISDYTLEVTNENSTAKVAGGRTKYVNVTNTYTKKEGPEEIPVKQGLSLTKAVSGTNAPTTLTDGAFTFSATSKSAPTGVTAPSFADATNTGNTVTFTAVEFSAEGEYVYEIAEKSVDATKASGFTKSNDKIYAKITVSKSGATYSASVKYYSDEACTAANELTEANVKITNAYSENGATQGLSLTKAVSGINAPTTLTDGAFTFSATSKSAPAGVTAPSFEDATNIGNTVTFTAVEFSAEGDYVYEIAEKSVDATKAPGFTKSNDKIYAKITVSKSGATYSASVKYYSDEVCTAANELTEAGIKITNSLTKVTVSKKAVGGEDELPGATIQILDKEGKVVELKKGDTTEKLEWTSTTEAKEIEGLTAGVEYTLHEEVAPNGYTVASDIKFTIDETGKVTAGGKVAEGGVVLIEDALSTISFSKIDMGGEDLIGAKLSITDKNGNAVKDINGKDVASWTSDGSKHEIKGLKDGEYIFSETTAPDGYEVAESIRFEVENGVVVKVDGQEVDKITELTMQDKQTKITVSKKAVDGTEELPGAKIQILDKATGKVVELKKGNATETLEWISGTEAKTIEGLTTGVEYILKETVAPDGYTIASEITFTIDSKGKVTAGGKAVEGGAVLIEDALSTISFSKTDMGGEDLIGAKLSITDKNGNAVKDINGKDVASWTSDGSKHEIKGLKDGEYIFTETTAPDGYEVAESIRFEVENGVVVKVDGQEVDKITELTMQDKQTKITVSKKAVDGTEELPGAKIQILDKATGKVVELKKGNTTETLEWISGTEAKTIEGLTTGVEYILKETVAPDGYTIASEIVFTIDAKGKVTAGGKVAEGGVVLIEDDLSTISFSKTDMGGEDLIGAKLSITDKDGNAVKDINGKDVASWTSDGSKHEIKGLKDGEYIFTETTAPDGYEVAESIRFEVENGVVVKVDGQEVDKITELTMQDKQTKITVSKKAVDGTEELPGATIQILDKDGKVVELKKGDTTEKLEWVSGTAAKEIEGLTAGVEYTLHEEVAPNGYTVASDIKFTIDKTGKVTAGGKEVANGALLINDDLTKVKVSKTDITGEEEIAGATLQIIEMVKDAQTGVVTEEKIIETWVSQVDDKSTLDVNEAIHEKAGLKTGVDYVLRETVAPDGYAVTTDTAFKLDKDGKVTYAGTVTSDGVMLVMDAKTSVTVSKRDITGGEEELSGAKLQILTVGEDDKESVVEIDGKKVEWTSTDKAKTIEGLKSGVEYILRETTAPDGYTITSDTKFKIEKDGTITVTQGSQTPDGTILVNDAPTTVSISKVDVDGGKEIPGAHIQILDAAGDVAKDLKGEKAEWTSTDEPHVVTGLKTGVVYTLHETIAPASYTLATDTTFTIEADGKVKVIDAKSKTQDDKIVLLVEDAKTVVKVSKVDIVGGAELVGAEIEIRDSQGNLRDSWTSVADDETTTDVNEAVHEIKGLLTGETYTMTELVAPNGYEIATETTFTIDANGKVTVTGSKMEDGVILIEDAMTEITVSKKAVAGSKELPGAQIVILDKNEQIVTTAAGEELKWTSGNTEKTIKGLKTGVEYTLRETVAPAGYTVATDIKFTLDEKGNVKINGRAVEGNALLIEDALTTVKISKTDIADGAEIEGARMQLLKKGENGQDELIKRWVSGTEAETITGLLVDQTYILRETVAPNGYAVTTDIEFTVDKNNNVTTGAKTTIDTNGVATILVEDSKTVVKVSKTDITGSEELSGARIELLDVDENAVVLDGKAVAWTSNGQPKVIIGLKARETYILRETVAPAGCTIAADTIFTLNADGSVSVLGEKVEGGHILIKDDKTKVRVSKVDIAGGEEVAGATIQILDNENKVVKEWTSKADDEATKDVNEGVELIEGLLTGVTYTLRETVAPDGYTIATDTTFTIDETGKVTTTGKTTEDGVLLVEDALTKITVSKKAVGGEDELEGATIQILDKKTGEVVELKKGDKTEKLEWTSGKEEKTIEGLKTGVEYVLKETVAPDGYTIASETTFTIDTKGNVTAGDKKVENGALLIEDALSTISFSKTDMGGEDLIGANLSITDKEGRPVKDINGKEVASWTSDGSEHKITGLKDGEYIFTETTAPDGYTVAESIRFEVENGVVVKVNGENVSEITELTMQDEQTKITVSKKAVGGEDELEGATIQILNKETGKVVELKKGDKIEKLEWTSGKEEKTIEGLKTGVEYVLKETVAPDGYTIASETIFKIDEKGNVTAGEKKVENGALLIEDDLSTISFSKTDMGGEDLIGADLSITDKDGKPVKDINGKEVEGWTSDGSEHKITGLKDGEYIFTETTAPDGYAVAESIRFEVENGVVVKVNGQKVEEITELTMKDEYSKVNISKTAVGGGPEIPNAVLKITTEDDKEVTTIKGEKIGEHKTDGKSQWIVEGLKDGKYKLTEETAPDGFVVAESIIFEIKDGKVVESEDAKNGVVRMEDAYTKVTISKKAVGGEEELPGATIQIIDKETGEVVNKGDGQVKEKLEWVSGDTPKVIEGLTPGKTYVLKETVAPDGYTIASETEFVIDVKGNVTSGDKVVEGGALLIEDALSTISFRKTDMGGVDLIGAELVITDANGETVETWTSDGNPHDIVGMKDGEYTFTEITAPDGFDVAESITFTVENGVITLVNGSPVDQITELTMQDQPTEDSGSGSDSDSQHGGTTADDEHEESTDGDSKKSSESSKKKSTTSTTTTRTTGGTTTSTRSSGAKTADTNNAALPLSAAAAAAIAILYLMLEEKKRRKG